ncbi:hypothetical protein KCP76_04055 [Salmonella enterica subsp. enterica serovar Weltevreden]|nr:hypothetical protein KCP76_04055 [Salmonella enterica subsp. enterica serovar Weltevreden]
MNEAAITRYTGKNHFDRYRISRTQRLQIAPEMIVRPAAGRRQIVNTGGMAAERRKGCVCKRRSRRARGCVEWHFGCRK